NMVVTGASCAGVCSAGVTIGAACVVATWMLGTATCFTACSVGTVGGVTSGGGCSTANSDGVGGAWSVCGVLGSSATSTIARFKLNVSAIAKERVACGAHSNERGGAGAAVDGPARHGCDLRRCRHHARLLRRSA